MKTFNTNNTFEAKVIDGRLHYNIVEIIAAIAPHAGDEVISTALSLWFREGEPEGYPWLPAHIVEMIVDSLFDPEECSSSILDINLNGLRYVMGTEMAEINKGYSFEPVLAFGKDLIYKLCQVLPEVRSDTDSDDFVEEYHTWCIEIGRDPNGTCIMGDQWTTMKAVDELGDPDQVEAALEYMNAIRRANEIMVFDPALVEEADMYRRASLDGGKAAKDALTQSKKRGKKVVNLAGVRKRRG